MNKRVTLVDVARHAGVSRATASLVLRGAGNLSDATRARVRESMDALGYVYHRGAASLRANTTKSVGMIVPDMTIGFTAELTVAAESSLAESGRVTLVANSLEDPDRQTLQLRSMLERQVDGILVIPAVRTPDSFFDVLMRAGLPVVVATRELPHPTVSYVGIDNVNGGRLAGEHLLFHGAERVAYLGGFAELKPRHDRVAGLTRALATHGVELAIDLPGPTHGSWGLEVTLGLIADSALPDAIVCHNDLVAFGVYRALREAGPPLERPPRVISYDDIATASLWEPPLTTVAANGQEVGSLCAEVLLRHIAQPGLAAERRLITSALIIRESCGCPPPRD
jgi:LacI family transcriptional regulator